MKLKDKTILSSINIYIVMWSLVTRAGANGPSGQILPDHFILGTHPLLVNAWDWYLQQNCSKNTMIINTSLERKFFSVSSALFC